MRPFNILIFIIALMFGISIFGTHFDVGVSDAPTTEVTSANIDLWTLMADSLDWAWSMTTWAMPDSPAILQYFWSFLKWCTLVCIVFVVRGIN